MKKLLFLACSLFVGSSAVADNTITLKCLGKTTADGQMVVNGVFASNDEITSMKAFFVYKKASQKPNPVFFFGKTKGVPGKRDPKNVNTYFTGDSWQSTTVYLPRMLSQARGSTVNMTVVYQDDGVPPSADHLVCNVK